MAPKVKFESFRAVRYSEEVDLERVICPPYDVISPAMKQSLELLHPENFVRITLPSSDDGEPSSKYEKAADYLRAWLSAGVLIEEPSESIFLYRNDFVLNKKPGATAGIIGALQLEPFGSSIHPHETTLPEPKADRLALMRTTSANLEPLWFVAAKPLESMASAIRTYEGKDPLADVEDSQSVRHRIWRLASEDAASVRAWIEGNDLVVADGHHRYETALAYARERRDADGPGEWDKTLALVAGSGDFAPTLRAIHRVVRGLDVSRLVEGSAATEFDEPPQTLSEAITASAERPTVGLVASSGSWKVNVADDLPTRFVQKLAQEASATVTYEHDLNRALEAVDRDSSVFVMPPIGLDLVISEALAGRTMPPKSTLFWPKPVSGLVMRRLQ